MNSPIVVAILVFLGIYFVWYSIRFFADFCLVGIALGGAVLAYKIPDWYPIFQVIWEESRFLNVFGLILPPDQPDIGATIFIASLIIIGAVLISIPFLPFSVTYRVMLGVEGPVFRRKEAKVRSWIIEEVQHYQLLHPEMPVVQSDGGDSDSGAPKKPSFFNKLEPSIRDLVQWLQEKRGDLKKSALFNKLGSSFKDFWGNIKNKVKSG